MLVAQVFSSGIGEEPGWRGYLLPRLQARFEGEKPIWILGLIWAIWHFPIVILQTFYMMQNVTVPQMIITIFVQLAGQTMVAIGMTFIYVWLYNQTRSVFLMILFHASSNLINVWLASFLNLPGSATVFIGLMPWALVFLAKRLLGKDKFPGIVRA